MAQILPIFCLRTSDKNTKRNLFVNFKSSDEVPPPDVDITEDQIVQQIYNPSPEIENLKVPLILGQIFWPEEKDDGQDNDCDSDYVIDVQINAKFAIRKVLASEIIRHYVATVSMVSIMDKFNSDQSNKLTNQFLGHKLELDQGGYEILKGKTEIKHSKETVNNKITLLQDNLTKLSEFDEISSFDLHLRPTSMLMTCCLRTDKLPDSISFNDDRFCIKIGDKSCVDVHLPLYIDLTHPMKYKFDDHLCLFRVVFRMKESIE